ncbi:MAG: hypothetical protein COV72_05235 [Candidatus Omnitrophica bacterium CG11_big_fil_rev_8_21_14_0_20_42_13]|uniref:PilZ domain-containing protein n=1 Tax=Candidatus Ghiorseimicrobium undicola TaxID=1974746 RepID=A0A2H0LXD5_9BACT|nr:MAG: hypothetical protein COV72_05235 [Candidatus Omnitrophica bacterium CG11_big_fil_rev_8_21_14_0_20_42_13]
MVKTKIQSERRRFIRKPMCFPLKYKAVRKWEGEDVKEEQSRAIDVSRGGLLFSSSYRIKKGQPLLLEVPLENNLFNVRAKVMRCNKSGGEKLYNIGVCFAKIHDAFQVKLIEQIYLIDEYRKLRSLQLGRKMSLNAASKEWIKRYSKRFEKLYW